MIPDGTASGALQSSLGSTLSPSSSSPPPTARQASSEVKKQIGRRWHCLHNCTDQVLSNFDNYLLTSVILITLAIALLMFYISCYTWVFRVTFTYNNIPTFPFAWFQGNLDLPKPTKAFSIKGRLDSFKPARRGGSNVKTFSNLISIQSGNPFYPIIKLIDLQSKLYPTIHLACLAPYL